MSIQNNLSANIDTSDPSQLGIDQDLVGSDELINSIVPYLLLKKNQTGSWNFSLHSQDDNVYTGMAGGLAGVGQNLLELSSGNVEDISQVQSDLAEDTAIEIGNYLANVAQSNAYTNDSGTFWPVTLGSEQIIDLGYDFGLAGMTVFFSSLYNRTETDLFMELAQNTTKAIDYTANKTLGLHWDSYLDGLLQNNFWYPNYEINQVFGVPPIHPDYQNYTYFNGRSLGSLGVAEAMLKSIKLLSIQNPAALEHVLLNSSIGWLYNQFNFTASELSFPISMPSYDFDSSSFANGMSGALDFFVNLYDFTGNSTYLTWSTGLVNWLNGSDSSIQRMRYTLLLNDTSVGVTDLGLSHGLTGHLQELWDYIEYNDDGSWNSTLTQLLSIIHQTGMEQGAYYLYPEQLSTGNPVNLGSISYQVGGGGILSLVDQVSDYLGLSLFDDDIAKAKAYVYNRVITESNIQVLSDVATSTAELNPSVGVPSSFHVLGVSVPGSFAMNETGLAFEEVEIGSSLSKSVVLQNLGDDPLSISWTDFPNIYFRTSTQSLELEGRTQYSLFIAFQPQEETFYEETINFDATVDNEYSITLNGTGFDLPTISSINVLENNSMIDTEDDIPFSVNATDQSGIEQVEMSINGSIQNMVTTSQSTIYNSTWDLTNIENGTYVISFTAYDATAQSNQNNLTYVYNVGIYDTPLDERLFSDRTLFILAGITVVAVVAAIFVTRRYRS